MMKKNRPFFVALAAIFALGTTASGQVRTCDLQIEINSPANNLEMHTGDTAWIEFTVTNNGPESILATDTLWFWDKSYVYPFLATSDIPAHVSKTFTRNEIGLPLVAPQVQSDVVAQFCTKLVNQSTIGNLDHVVTFEDPDTANNWSCVNVTLKADVPSGIFDMEQVAQEQLNLYPNPATSEIQFTAILEQAEQVLVSVKDITGREILYRNYGEIPAGNTSPFRLDIAGLHAGLYFVELNAGARKAVGKLIVQH